MVEATLKLMNAGGRVARNCEIVARTFSGP